MNHLAHLLLAGAADGDRLGALLGDHVKGRDALAALPPPLERGVRLHRYIDVLADGHPSFSGLLARLEPPFRRYGGVIIDVLFDHMLDRHWQRFSDVPLDRFADAVDVLFARHRSLLPERLRRFMAWARITRLWTHFGNREMLAEIFHRLASRHGRPSPLARGLEVLDGFDAAIEKAFLEMFPELMARAAEFREVEGPSNPPL